MATVVKANKMMSSVSMVLSPVPTKRRGFRGRSNRACDTANWKQGHAARKGPLRETRYVWSLMSISDQGSPEFASMLPPLY
jgi:hypothetical protein